MPARAIIRYSLERDYGVGNGTRVRNILQQNGFQSLGTASWERQMDGDPSAILPAVAHVVSALTTLTGGVTLDHLWIYVDELPPDAV